MKNRYFPDKKRWFSLWVSASQRRPFGKAQGIQLSKDRRRLGEAPRGRSFLEKWMIYSSKHGILMGILLTFCGDFTVIWWDFIEIHEISWGFYWDFIEMFVIGISWGFHGDWWVPHFMASLVLTVSTVILWMIWRFRRKRVGPQIIHLMRQSRALKPIVAWGTMWWNQFHNPFRKAP